MTSCRFEPSTPRGRYCRETDSSVTLAQALGAALPNGLRYAVAEVVIEPDASGALREHEARFPDEAALVRNAVPKRLFELLATRELARQLLVEMGEGAVSIPRGPMGAPAWPTGVVGTIAHSNGMAVVAMGRLQDYSSLGIDLEPNLPLPDGVDSHISLPSENDEAPASRALFVVKEAFYKAHCGIHHRTLDFKEVRVHWLDDAWSAHEVRPPTDTIGPTSSRGTLVVTAEWLAAFCAISSN